MKAYFFGTSCDLLQVVHGALVRFGQHQLAVVAQDEPDIPLRLGVSFQDVNVKSFNHFCNCLIKI